MGIQGFGIFTRLLRMDHTPQQMGLKGKAGDVVRWNTRVKLARNFRGLEVEGYTELTLQGYNALFRVFLTHSALELYRPIVNLDAKNDLLAALGPYNPDGPVKKFFALDRSGRLFDFLQSKLDKQRSKDSLRACREGASADVTCLSASVRHIFVHGHLSAHSNEIRPKQIVPVARSSPSSCWISWTRTSPKGSRITIRLSRASKAASRPAFEAGIVLVFVRTHEHLRTSSVSHDP